MRMKRMRKGDRWRWIKRERDDEDDEERERGEEEKKKKKRCKRGEKARLKEKTRWSAAPELHPEAVRGSARSGRIGNGKDVMHS